MRDPQKCKEQNCGNCDFSALDIDPDTKTALLTCRHDNPRPEVIYEQEGTGIDLEYPAVDMSEWCGQWGKGMALTAEQIDALEGKAAKATTLGGKRKA